MVQWHNVNDTVCLHVLIDLAEGHAVNLGRLWRLTLMFEPQSSSPFPQDGQSSGSGRAGYAAQCLYYFFNISTVAGNQTVFLLPVPSSALVTTADLECTHLMHAKSAVFTGATVSGDLAAGCMEAGIRLA